MLKKLFLIVMVSLLFIGCSKSDSSNSVNPPEWILGTWINVLDENKEIITFTTSDGYLETEKESSLFLFFDEKESTDTKYVLELKPGFVTISEQSHNFTKKDDNTIGYQIDAGVEIPLTKK
jgi:hypothetical protein